MERRVKVMQNFLQKRNDDGTKRTKCFTDGKRVWSYGRHYVLGEWTGINDSEGREILLVNNSSYSNTTSTMQRELQSVLHTAQGARIVYHNDGDILGYYLNGILSSFRLIKRYMRLEEEPLEIFYKAVENFKDILSVYKLLKGYGDVDMRLIERLNERDSSLQDIRSGISGMDEQLKAVAYMMIKDGADSFDGEIKKMPIQYIIMYKLFGGKLEIKKSVKNPVWNYLWLRDHLEPEEAIRFVSDNNAAIRKLASDRLSKGCAA